MGSVRFPADNIDDGLYVRDENGELMPYDIHDGLSVRSESGESCPTVLLAGNSPR